MKTGSIPVPASKHFEDLGAPLLFVTVAVSLWFHFGFFSLFRLGGDSAECVVCAGGIGSDRGATDGRSNADADEVVEG